MREYVEGSGVPLIGGRGESKGWGNDLWCCERAHGADASAVAFAGEGAVVHSSADGGKG